MTFALTLTCVCENALVCVAADRLSCDLGRGSAFTNALPCELAGEWASSVSLGCEDDFCIVVSLVLGRDALTNWMEYEEKLRLAFALAPDDGFCV